MDYVSRRQSVTVIIPATYIRWQRSSSDGSISGSVEAVEAKTVQDTVLPIGGEDSTPHALWKRLVVIQEGCVKWEGWGIPCAVTDTVSQQRQCRHHIPTLPTPRPDDANTAPRRHHHCIPMMPTSHPNNTDIVSH